MQQKEYEDLSRSALFGILRSFGEAKMQTLRETELPQTTPMYSQNWSDMLHVTAVLEAEMIDWEMSTIVEMLSITFEGDR